MTDTPRSKRRLKRARAFRLTERDHAVLDALRLHRYMRADHFHGLLSPSSGVRVVQWRLRRLWRNGYLDRRYLPYVARGNQPLPRRATRPIYALTSRAASVLRTQSGASEQVSYGFRSKSGALPALAHHLVVTDFMVALRIACQARPELCLEKIEHEHLLWPQLAAAGSEAKRGGPVVPDAAFTLLSARGKRLTFYLEVVRAGVKGGNRRGLRGKLERYSKLNYRRFFEYAYRHKNLRAVLFTTTSPARADGFRAHAEAIRHSRNLFWFGSYRDKTVAEDATVFTPANVLTLPWQTATDTVFTIEDAMKETSI